MPTAPQVQRSGMQLQRAVAAWAGLVIALAVTVAWITGDAVSGLAVFVAASVASGFVAFVARRALNHVSVQLARSEALRAEGLRVRDATAAGARADVERAEALLDAVPDVLLRLAKDGVVRAVRNGDDSSIGAKLSPQVGSPLDAVFTMTSPQSVAEAVKIALEGEPVAKVSAEIGVSDGHRRVEVRVVRTSDDECLGLVRDIT